MVLKTDKPIGYEAVLRPNRSSSWKESMIFLSIISALALIVAIVFLVLGFWMILPFTGLELLLLATCLFVVAREGQRCQVISINEKSLKIAKGWSRNDKLGPEEEYEFPLAWVRLIIETSNKRWYPDKLLIGSSGKFVEVGEFLPENERKDLAEMLKSWLANVARK